MAETATPDAPASDKGEKKGKGGIKAFIKKNKTLSAVAGVGGIYFLWKMRQEPAGEVHAVGEGEEPSPDAGLGGTAELAAYEVGRAERAQERTSEDLQELEDENRARIEKEKQAREEAEEERDNARKSPEPGPADESPSPTAGANGISIHGKTFKAATSSHIANSGKTTGGKKYVEYAIQFPGRVEHWQYFTDTGNWRQVKNSAGGAAGNNNKPSGSAGTTSGGTSGKKTGGGAGKPSNAKPAAKIGAAQVASAAPAQPHPQAVNTGLKCVNGGVGPHTAPANYHLFCQGGTIWRAPNK